MWSQHRGTLGVGDVNTVDLDYVCMCYTHWIEHLQWALLPDCTSAKLMCRTTWEHSLYLWKFWFRRSRIEPTILLSFPFTPSIPASFHLFCLSSPFPSSCPTFSLHLSIKSEVILLQLVAPGELVIPAEEHRLVVNSSDYKSVSGLCK